MKLSLVLLTLAVASFALFIAGCGGDADSEPAAPVDMLTDAEEAVSDAAEEATGGVSADAAARDRLSQAKDKFITTIEERLGKLASRMEGLKTQVVGTGAIKEAAYDEIKVAWDKQMAEAKAKLRDIQSAGADSWEDMKAELETAISDLQKAFIAAEEKLK